MGMFLAVLEGWCCKDRIFARPKRLFLLEEYVLAVLNLHTGYAFPLSNRPQFCDPYTHSDAQFGARSVLCKRGQFLCR